MRRAKTLKLELTSAKKDGTKTDRAIIYNENNYFKLRVTIQKNLQEFFIS